MKKSVAKVSLRGHKSDFAYWQTQPYAARLAALEQIRQDIIGGSTVFSQDFKEFIGS